ncbi:MAG TPA: hypothetical protein VHX65_15580 [Pirellulales bacterium]|jgi:hypothetical protein|nr:hypothetical protein [Pirellulales bacterium]
MKKVKLKLDMDQLKQFGIEHGEKFGLAAAVLILGVFIVKAASRETLPENLSPEAIKRNSATADSNLRHLRAPPADQDVKGKDFASTVVKVNSLPKGLAEISRISQPPFEDPIKRNDPTLFKVEELRATPFRGGLCVVSNGVAAAPPILGQQSPPARVAPAPASGGLIPGRITGRPGRPAARPPVATTRDPLAGAAAGGAEATQPFPAGFTQPGPQASGEATGVYGIVVTGLVPDQAQREEYERRFKHARHAEAEAGAGRGRNGPALDSDTPKYVWCVLERTDTTDGKTITLDFGDMDQIRQDYKNPDPTLLNATKEEVNKLHLSRATMLQLDREQKTWAVQVPEVAAPEFVMEKWFTWPLPPVLLRVWGEEAAHLPQVPLAPPVAAAGRGMAPPAVQPGPGQADFGADPNAAGGGRGAAPVSRRYPPIVGGARARADAELQAQEVPYKLFRFIDLNVEPGHSYKYRVQMLLRNPNFGLEPQVLLKPETAMVAYKQTPWSDTSPTAAIPQDTRLLGGNIDRPKHQEPKAKIGVFTFDKVQAIELIKEFETDLGALVGTTVADQTVKGVADPVQRVVRDIQGKFRTPSVLLDLRGNDEKLPGTEGMTEPAEMLLLDDVDDPANPRLIVVNEAKDKPIVDDWKQTHIPPAAPAATPAPGGAPKAGNGLLPGGGLLPPRNGPQSGRRGNR